MAAMVQRDRPALEAAMAPGFTLSGATSDGRPPLPRGVWIDNALHHLRLDDAHIDEARARVRGDTATVNLTLTWAGAYDGERFAETVRLLDTWERRDGRWRVASRRVGAAVPR